MSTDRETTKAPRGFAALTPEARAEISRKGGKQAHANGTAHRWNSDTARDASRKSVAKREKR